MTWRPRAIAGYAAWLLLLASSYYGFPGARPQCLALMGLGGAIVIAAGAAGNRRARPGGARGSRVTPWLLLAGAGACLAASQAALLGAGGVSRAGGSREWIGAGFSVAACLLATAGLLIFLRWRAPGRERYWLDGALVVTSGLAVACWLGVVLGHGPSVLAPPGRALAVVRALGDVLVLAMAGSLVAAQPAPRRPPRLLALGAAGLLASDLAYLLRVAGVRGAVLFLPLGWVLCYGAWAAAALDPAMTHLTEPALGQQPGRPALRLMPVALAALSVPGALIAVGIRHQPADLALGAVGLLMLGCLADVAVTARRASRREGVVRGAAAAFAAAATIEDVAGAAVTAVITLSGQRQFRAQLAVRDGNALRIVGAAGPDSTTPGPGPAAPGAAPEMSAAAGAAPTDAVPVAWLPVLAAPGPLLIGAGPADGSLGPGDAGRGVLLCPLTTADTRPGDPPAGVLAIFGRTHALAAAAAALGFVAAQAAAATRRVTLGAAAERSRSDAYFRALVADSADAIIVVADDGTVGQATPAAEKIFGTGAVVGASLPDLAGPAGREAAAAAFARMCDDAGALEDWLITRPDGTRAEVQVSCRDLRDDRTIAGLVLTLRDVSEQRSLQRELTYRAFHDALTGLPNRSLFTDRITHALARPRRAGTALAVLVVDLDDFNVVNDTMGHAVGDELLVAAAGRLSGLADGSHTAARLGGDEFAILIEEAADDATVESFAERIVQAFTKPFLLMGGPLITTVTVGVASTHDSTDAGDLVRHADLALYAAKAAGKRQWRRYQPILSVGMARRRELKAAIEEAVGRSAFTLAYQPIVVLASGEIAGFEALVRWPHPRWGMILPDQFISLAEETGYIVPLGSWVLRQAAADLAEWRRQVPRQASLYISVNVSARQFREPGFVEGVQRVLADSGLAPSSLQLELTESVLLGRDERIAAELAELKGLGVRLAIDDFGTGYSSLSYLRELPMNMLKVDKSFTEGIALSKARLALVEVIIRMARTLGLAVTAEGIESEVQRELLISLGCEFGQGYLLEKPVAAEEAQELARVGLRRELHATTR